jgi:hypothetical protein
MNKAEMKIGREVKMLFNKSSQQTKFMKTNEYS